MYRTLFIGTILFSLGSYPSITLAEGNDECMTDLSLASVDRIEETIQRYQGVAKPGKQDLNDEYYGIQVWRILISLKNESFFNKWFNKLQVAAKDSTSDLQKLGQNVTGNIKLHEIAYNYYEYMREIRVSKVLSRDRWLAPMEEIASGNSFLQGLPVELLEDYELSRAKEMKELIDLPIEKPFWRPSELWKSDSGTP